MPTIAEIISIYPIAQYLAANEIQRGGLNGGGIDVSLPRKIYMVGKGVQRIYDDDPSNETLTETANYLYSLCGKFGLQALVVSQSAGSISPVTPTSALPLQIEFYVSASSLIPTGGNTVILTSFIGYNLLFTRGLIPQPQANPGDGSNYCTWNRTTGEFFCYTDALLGEFFQLTPIG